MEVHKLFQIFENSPSRLVEDVPDVLYDNFTLLQTAVVTLQYLYVMGPKYKQQYPKEFESKFPIIQKKYFDKAFTAIDLVEVSLLETTPFTFYQDEKVLIDSTFSDLLNYFAAQEEYEKCSKIKKVQDSLRISIIEESHIKVY